MNGIGCGAGGGRWVLSGGDEKVTNGRVIACWRGWNKGCFAAVERGVPAVSVGAGCVVRGDGAVICGGVCPVEQVGVFTRSEREERGVGLLQNNVHTKNGEESDAAETE